MAIWRRSYRFKVGCAAKDVTAHALVPCSDSGFTHTFVEGNAVTGNVHNFQDIS